MAEQWKNPQSDGTSRPDPDDQVRGIADEESDDAFDSDDDNLEDEEEDEEEDGTF